MRTGPVTGVNSSAATARTATVARTIQRKRGLDLRKIMRNAVSIKASTTNNIATIAANRIAGEASAIEVSCIIGATVIAIPQNTVDSATVRSAPLRIAPSIANTAVMTGTAYGPRTIPGGFLGFTLKFTP